MFDYVHNVSKVMKVLWINQQPFTVFDITRMLIFKFPGENISHNLVKHVVEASFFRGDFPVDWKREIGYHLSYSPHPQIYHQKLFDITKYDPNCLEDHKTYYCSLIWSSQTEVTKTKTAITKVNKSKEPVASLLLIPPAEVYAVKHRTKNLWIGSHKTKKAVNDLSKACFYSNKMGPGQILQYFDRSQWEIVKYKVSQ